jgi:hypothetical protein
MADLSPGARDIRRYFFFYSTFNLSFKNKKRSISQRVLSVHYIYESDVLHHKLTNTYQTFAKKNKCDRIAASFSQALEGPQNGLLRLFCLCLVQEGSLGTLLVDESMICLLLFVQI